MSEQEKFEVWWKEKGFNSVILRAAALTAWMARAEMDKEQRQPAEDPDEWVIQDRVPVRVKIDRCWYMDCHCGLPADPEDMWQKYAKDQFLDGKKHGDYVRDGGGTLHVMCRRRDLPKVEQAEQWPKYWETDGTAENVAFIKQTSEERFYFVCFDGSEELQLVKGFRPDRTRKQLTEAEAMAMLNKPEPQPAKPPVGIMPRRLWMEQRCDDLRDAITRYEAAERSVASEWRIEEALIQDALRADEPQQQKTTIGTDWSYHEKQKPQPKKTMLRLWVDLDCNIHAGLKGDRDLELYYDHETRQFYTEEQP